MVGYFDVILSQINAPIWLLYLIIAWEVVWKLIALWIAAKHKHVAWFIVMGVLNTLGILPILYIYIFSKLHHPSFKKQKEETRKITIKKKIIKPKSIKRKK